MSPQELWKWDWDYAWHFLIGLGSTDLIALGMWFAPDFPLRWLVAAANIPAMFAMGILRERSQDEDTNLTPHQWAEALLWGIGAILGWGISLIWML